MSQEQHSRVNQQGWNHSAYEAWTRLGGTPEQAAARLSEDPAHTLRDYRAHLGDLRGKEVANLLGSHGKKAIAMALLGAQVTVVDISEQSRRYALETAAAAGVDLEYHCSDLLEWPLTAQRGRFDLVLMEYGILHYFTALAPLARLVEAILKPGGQWVLHEYHPMVRKGAPQIVDGQLLLKGDYFSEEIVERPAPYQMAFTPEEVEAFPLCRYKFWQMGEIVSAVGASGLVLKVLAEKPHGEYKGLPGMFTLVAQKATRG